ncbi:unnamed protein product [Ceutorhynchus assimilis]|uniref:Regulator of telomere elongation helicase 1 homolog n=1 Tax=Ceutorhynchus assimilis TaxID=467358 RepID=A0A9N9MGM8_9CUCU|nr:unnamed protein product [Ceutorhynchus assimilis]
MSVTTEILGVPVIFPFQPYDIQKDYMEKVIECLQKETTAVLESPTGTGKTLSLLCSSLAWLQLKKAQIQAKNQVAQTDLLNNIASALVDVNEKADNLATGRDFLALPTIIYASRTHSQLTQAVQELRRTAYNHMHSSVLGSREQLCIHPEILSEQDRSVRLHMCQLKVKTRACHYNNRVERMKDSPEICNVPIIDIEDMVKMGNKHTFCPYYMTKERQRNADIIFTPYNYLLDPVARKALGLNLSNAVVILDEGHNVEKVCEESASFDLKSTDIALIIDETTNVMKMISEAPGLFEESTKGDIDPDELANFKSQLLDFEKALDAVPLSTSTEVTHFPGDYIFELLEKAQIKSQNAGNIILMLDKMIQFLTAQNDNSPFARKGKGLQIFNDFLLVVFQSKVSKEKIKECYKVHVKEEEPQYKSPRVSTWLEKKTTVAKSRTLSFWCFNPGFGMDYLVSQGIRAMILTSGTLAPLKPLISELELDVKVRLENPHIVKDNQILVRILPMGPSGEALNSSYRNRDNPNYVAALGRVLVNLTSIIPNGVLIFFPSYPIMLKCKTFWEQNGTWGDIYSQKAIFVEPKGKDAFHDAMTGYYEKVRDPNLRGAIFMGVCRGKVSEGLDFADANGRAVIITGLPYPPLKDARVILKRRYLDTCHARDREYLNGQDWYNLEASRAVNQAIGRVIRHRYDYGAIILLDERFRGATIMNQMSKWLRDHIKVVDRYGLIIRDLSQFFKKAQSDLPCPVMKPVQPPKAVFEMPRTYKKESSFDWNSPSSSTSDIEKSQCSGCSSDSDMDKYLEMNKKILRESCREELLMNTNKKRKYRLNQNPSGPDPEPDPVNAALKEYVLMVKEKLAGDFVAFAELLRQFRETKDIEIFIKQVDSLIPRDLKYILCGLYPFIQTNQKQIFGRFLLRNNLRIPEDL